MLQFLGLRKVFIPLLVIAIILILLFLPEIIGLKSVNTKLANKVNFQKEVTTPPEIKKEEKKEIVYSSPLQSFEAKLSGELPDSKLQYTKFQEYKLYDKERITPAFLKSALISKNLKFAYSKSKYLYKKIDQNYKYTRRSLFNFITTLEKIIQTSSLPSNAIEIVEYLEEQEHQVSLAMLHENVERKFILKWTEISLTEVYQSEQAYDFKKLAVSNFNPSLQIYDMSFKLKTNSSNFSPEDVRYVRVNFMFLGSGIKKLRIYRNGAKISFSKNKKRFPVKKMVSSKFPNK